MKKFIICVAVLSMALFSGCKKDKIATLDREYVLFPDTLLNCPVLMDEGYSFKVPVTSTVACDYDRTFAVEIIDKGSTAVEERDFRLRSNTVVIPAGKYSGNIEILPVYESFKTNDTLSVNLKLVSPEETKWDMYGDRTTVAMHKVCPFSLDNFTGYCLVGSLFLYQYPGNNTSMERLVETEAVPGKENTILMKDWLFDGYDVTLTFDPSDPLNPKVTMEPGQVISDEATVFGQILGDNRIKAEVSPMYLSYYNSCQRFVALWIRVYVDKMATPVGTVGHFYHVMEWKTDEEAEELKNEGY